MLPLAGRVVYLYGGRSKSGAPLDDLHVLDLEANFWSCPKPKSDKPAGRFGHCAASHGETLYVFGGQSKGQATFAFHEEFPKPSIMGGDKRKGKKSADHECCDELLTYSTSSMEWNECSYEGMSPSPRYKHGSCLVPERAGQARLIVFGGCDEEDNAMNDLCTPRAPHARIRPLSSSPAPPLTRSVTRRVPFSDSLDINSTTWSVPETTGSTPSPRFGHSVTLLPAVRKMVVLGGTDGKLLDPHSAADPEFPPHKNARSFCGMSVHMLDLDSLSWSTVTCKNAGTGAEPSARAYHSATLLGKNLFVTGGQVLHGLLAHTLHVHIIVTPPPTPIC